MNRFAALVGLALKSAWNRRLTLFLIVLSVSLSTVLLVGLERVRGQVKTAFVQAISGTDLVIGARGSQIQLILYAVFHLGGATNNMGWDSAQNIEARKEVAWTIPLSMGDSHRGYPVVATNENFFKYFRYRRDKALTLSAGRPFAEVFEVVLGSEVAGKLGYKLKQNIVLRHGMGQMAPEHGDKPFTVVGVLAPTGSPVDRSLYINLESMEAIHIDWRGGAPIRGFSISAERAKKMNLTPKSITALLVGLKNRREVFALQREIQSAPGEALSAVMPGVALDQLWRVLGSGEKVLWLVSILVTATGLMGLVSSVLAGLGERRRELAILRSVGARPFDILSLLALESLALTVTGVLVGLTLLAVLVIIFAPIINDLYGIAIELSLPTARELLLGGAIVLAGSLAGLIPAVRAYFLSLGDGLSVSV
ncbi:MAG: ABC transporter permease [Deltaproteobacteria bacterium]|jgi:putative ABC transport system permease protein|nr:ABC transporter permease [Deltaproteobacteria bacterium]